MKMYKSKRRWFNTIVASILAVTLQLSLITELGYTTSFAAAESKKNVTRLERLEQPVSTYEFQKDELGVVNFHP
ncbi:MAG: hypothetical protein II699_06345, partial [Lachnospiraceae bacterium]|nr:hypothetical protein [Lachnospiraceae bacterium]